MNFFRMKKTGSEGKTSKHRFRKWSKMKDPDSTDREDSGVHLEDSSSSSRHYQDGGSDQEGLSREASPVFNRHALQTRRHTDTSPSLVQHQRQKTYGDYLTVPGGHHHALRRHTDTGLEEEDIPEARLAVQFQDKCRLRGLSPSPSRHSKHAYDSAIELESDGSKSRCSSEHLDVPPSSPISSGQSTPTEVEQGAAEGQDTKEREVRKNRFKKILRPIRRSHSAGCTKDVPAYALFLQKAMPASSGNLPRRSSQPSQMDKMEQEVDIPQVVVEEKAKKKSKNLVKDVKRRLRQVRRTHTDSVVTVEPARTLQPTPSQAGKWSQSFEALLADKCGLGLFQEFLRTEFSEENIEFWIACEEFKNTKLSKLADKAQKVYSDFVAVQAPKEINLDSKTRLATLHTIRHPDRHAFDAAQKRIQGLMEKDSYPRFLQSQMYKQLIS
ncbi:uncharacterized protein LOC106153075 isoform X1 [Lingula anatina]|uniref:Uncharacterized protein LOC106153075 isoform X1 n=1 Tax=Lingula anatina TaxID=7574 RepID=A0A1S3HAY8_LINAN|nr:uncharacterized protein LOC106153075 isoform X1 [Lingula anatina]|eukprot:XP_013382309.1 uncharacterized protein LOC106153075 isoform X1 [Lingula anatina]